MAEWLLVRDDVILDYVEDSMTAPFEDMEEGDILIRNPNYPDIYKWCSVARGWKLHVSSNHSLARYMEFPPKFFMSALLLGIDSSNWTIMKSTQ